MVGRIFDDVRRLLLGLLFFVAFGWMAAQVLPGHMPAAGWQQVAQVDLHREAQVNLQREVVPPRP